MHFFCTQHMPDLAYQLLHMDVLKSVSPHQLCLSTLEGVYQGEGPKYNLRTSVEVQDWGT